jgi:hypothetical protein
MKNCQICKFNFCSTEILVDRSAGFGWPKWERNRIEQTICVNFMSWSEHVTMFSFPLNGLAQCGRELYKLLETLEHALKPTFCYCKCWHIRFYTSLSCYFMSNDCVCSSSSSNSKGKGVPRQAEVAPGVPVGYGSGFSSLSALWRWKGRHPYAPAVFTPRSFPGTHF